MVSPSSVSWARGYHPEQSGKEDSLCFWGNRRGPVREQVNEKRSGGVRGQSIELFCQFHRSSCCDSYQHILVTPRIA